MVEDGPSGGFLLLDGGTGPVPADEVGAGIRGFLCLKSEQGGRAADDGGDGTPRLRLGDFCACAAEVKVDGGRGVLETLVRHALGEDAHCSDPHGKDSGPRLGEGGERRAGSGGGNLGLDRFESSAATRADASPSVDLVLKMPRPVAASMGYCDAARGCEDGLVVEAEEHTGTMFLALGGTELRRVVDPASHVTWAVDAF